jgi:dolichyl-phosphate beta-glucosyltransferase
VAAAAEVLSVTRGTEDCLLTVVIPAYNEATRIAEPLRRVDGYLREHEPSSEILVVDDGSTDGTSDVVRGVAAELDTPVDIIPSSPNRGKGHAVKLGVLRARGQAILVTDADLSTPIEELDKLYPLLDHGAAVAIGSRKMLGAALEVRQPIVRETMGRVFTWLTQRLLVRLSDITCGFKLFRRDAANEIFSRVMLDDWSYDAEALYLAKRLGYDIREAPVRWRDCEGTKVNRGRDAIRAAIGLARIRLNDTRGRYALDRTARSSARTPAADTD